MIVIGSERVPIVKGKHSNVLGSLGLEGTGSGGVESRIATVRLDGIGDGDGNLLVFAGIGIGSQKDVRSRIQRFRIDTSRRSELI